MKFTTLRLGLLAAIGLLQSSRAVAQSDAEQLTPILAQLIQTPDVTAYQLRQYLMGRMSPLPSPVGAPEWTAEAKRIRRHLLDEVVFHGWPSDWVNAPPKFEEAGVIEGNGYRIRKFRDEIVPGFQSADVGFSGPCQSCRAPCACGCKSGPLQSPAWPVTFRRDR